MNKQYLLSFITLYLIVSIFTENANAQFNSEYTQYVFNGLSLNPAYAGSRRIMNAKFIYRNQYLRVDGGPLSQGASFEGPIYEGNTSLGIWIENDEFDIYNQLKLYGIFSYRVQINKKVSLNLGLQAGIKNYSYDNSVLINSVNINPEFYTAINQENQLLPNIGAGVYLYSDKFAFGFAAPHLVASSIYVSDSLEFNTLNHYFLTGAYVFPLGFQLKMKPEFVLKILENAPVELSIGLHFLINEAIWFGAIWRNYDDIDLLVSYQLNHKMRFGYAHDIQSRRITGQTGSAHEILLGYDFVYSDKQKAMPRYF